MDRSKTTFLIFNKNKCCDPSLEPSRLDGSNDVSQNMFLRKIWIIIPKLSLLSLLIWSSVKSYYVLHDIAALCYNISMTTLFLCVKSQKLGHMINLKLMVV